MSRKSMEIYARRSAFSDPLLASARYPTQREGVIRARMDILRKLDLQPTDTLMDIGAGIGEFAIPLSYFCAETYAIDGGAQLNRLEHRAPHQVSQYQGHFLELATLPSVNKVLVYAVLHYLTDADEVLAFVDKALDLLLPGGRALFGDLPNVDRKRRFLATVEGFMFDEAWRAQMEMYPEWDVEAHGLPVDTELVTIDDALVARMVALAREKGMTATVLSQPDDLPFGYVREDLLVDRPQIVPS